MLTHGYLTTVDFDVSEKSSVYSALTQIKLCM